VCASEAQLEREKSPHRLLFFFKGYTVFLRGKNRIPSKKREREREKIENVGKVHRYSTPSRLWQIDRVRKSGKMSGHYPLFFFETEPAGELHVVLIRRRTKRLQNCTEISTKTEKNGVLKTQVDSQSTNKVC